MFINICKLGSFKDSFAMITSLSEFYFRFRRFILLVLTKKVISINYGQQHKQLRTMEVSEAGPDTFGVGYIHQFQPEPTNEIY